MPKRIGFLLMLCVLTLSLLAGCIGTDPGKLRIEVSDITTQDMRTTITLQCKNTLDSSAGFRQRQVWITTDQGVFDVDYNGASHIPRGDSQRSFTVNAPGTVQKIVFSQLQHDGNHRHDHRVLNDVTVYDIASGITYFEGTTDAFDNPDWLQDLLPWIFVPLALLLVCLRPIMLVVYRIMDKQEEKLINQIFDKDTDDIDDDIDDDSADE